MLTFGSLLTIGGAGIAVGMVETLLETMGKEKYAKVINIIAVSILAFIGLKSVFVLLEALKGLVFL